MTFDWTYTFSLFGNSNLWRASLTVVELAVLAWVCATAAGLLVALAKQSRLKPVRWVAGVYVWFFRSLPLLVLLIFVYNARQLVPALGGLLSSPFVAGFVALLLSETAYMAEIHRGGLISVARGQGEAAQALGIPYAGVQRHIVVPQAFRVALPALGNQFITILKLTSLVSVISLAEILLVGQRLYTQNFLILETLFAVSLYYVFLVTIFDQVRSLLERRLDVQRRGGSGRAQVASAEPQERRGTPREARERRPHSGEVVMEVKDLGKHYGETQVLDGIDLQVHRGEVVAIIGPSGSGKTTLLRTLNALESADAGEVLLAGEPVGYRLAEDGTRRPSNARQIAEQRGHVGMVFQHFNLFPHKTALENVTLAPLYLKRGGSDEVEQIGRSLLRKVGLEQHAHKYPHQLSGGQQQRVAIARALAMQPDVLLFDEPTSALDPELVSEVLDVMTELATEGMTMVVVTHEMHFARDVCDWVVFLDHGRVVNQAPPSEIFSESADERIRRFLAGIGV